MRLFNKLQANKLKSCKGFTLIETIIYMGILAVVLLVVTNVLITTSYFSQEETARLAIQKNGRFSVERITRDLQDSQSVVVPSDATPTGNLVLMTSGGSQVNYDLSGGNLERTTEGSAEKVTSNQVRVDLHRFSRIENIGGKPSIGIELKINYIGEVEGKRDISQDFITTYSLK